MRAVFALCFVLLVGARATPLRATDLGDTTQLLFHVDAGPYDVHPFSGLMRSCPSCILTSEHGAVFVYVGPLIKSVDVSCDDAIQVKAGHDLSLFTSNLAEWFGVSTPGVYTLLVRGDVAVCVYPEGVWDTWWVSYSVGVRITERHVDLARVSVAKRHSAMDTPLMSVQYSTSSCSASQQSVLVTVTDLLGSRVDDAVAYLNAGCVGCKYVHMFGAYSAGRVATVKDGFVAMASRISSSSFIYDCSGASPCSDGTLAFVYAADATHRIHLCAAYWSLSTAWAYDSKPGTICHELSHFSTIAETQDHAYGISNALALAVSSPDNAVDNADNWEYFVEQGVSPVGCSTSTSCGDVHPEASSSSAGVRMDVVGVGLLMCFVVPQIVAFMW